MKQNIFRWLTFLTTLSCAVFIFFDWFKMSIIIEESFSFMTIPSLLEDAMRLIIKTQGKTFGFLIILLVGILKYMCILSSGLGIYGIWKCVIKKQRSSSLFISQVIALGLGILAIIIIFAGNAIISGYVDASSINILEATLWLWICVISSFLSLIFQTLYSKNL